MNTISNPSVEDYERMLGVNLGLDIMRREPAGTVIAFDRLNEPVSAPAIRMIDVMRRHAGGFNSTGSAFTVKRLKERAAEAGYEVTTGSDGALAGTVLRKVATITPQ